MQSSNSDDHSAHGVCRLCQKPAELQMSHVLPAFLFRWLKKSGPIRVSGNINRRTQDGDKRAWLCRACEELFNTFETPFANQVFHPFDKDSALRIRYGEWMLKFCVSVSWRSLLHMRQDRPRFEHFSERQNERANEALQVWGELLRGERAHPGSFQQHVFPFSEIESSRGVSLPANVNRYLMRTVDMDAAAGESMSFVLSKLGPIGIVGLIDVRTPNDWRATKVGVQSGTLGPRELAVTPSFWHYLMDRALRLQNSQGKLSPTQQHRIDASVLANPDRFRESGLYRAMQRDIEMFGEAAFQKYDASDEGSN